ERESLPVRAARARDRVGDRLEGSEAVRGEAAEAVGRAGDDGVADAEREQRARRSERAGAGGAGGRDRVAGARHPEQLGDEARGPAELELRVVEGGAERAGRAAVAGRGLGIAPARG